MDRNRKPIPIKGYPSLAAFIASDPDHSTAIFKRFDRLSSRNILYLQSELAELEALQDEYDLEDMEASLDEKRGRRDWTTFQNRASTTTQAGQGHRDATAERDRKRMELAMKIRGKLKEYSTRPLSLIFIPALFYSLMPETEETILLESSFLTMQRPSNQASKAFHNYFRNQDDPNGSYPTLLGASSSVYEDKEDLLAVVRPPDEDFLTSMLRRHFSRLFLIKPRIQSGSVAYMSAALSVAAVNTLFAAMLLFGAVVNLYLVKTDSVKLGLIAGYTVLFATYVGLVTNARRAEIFGACAAYTAVLVVFVSGNLGGSSVGT